MHTHSEIASFRDSDGMPACTSMLACTSRPHSSALMNEEFACARRLNWSEAHGGRREHRDRWESARLCLLLAHPDTHPGDMWSRRRMLPAIASASHCGPASTRLPMRGGLHVDRSAHAVLSCARHGMMVIYDTRDLRSTAIS